MNAVAEYICLAGAYSDKILDVIKIFPNLVNGRHGLIPSATRVQDLYMFDWLITIVFVVRPGVFDTIIRVVIRWDGVFYTPFYKTNVTTQGFCTSQR